MKYTRNPEEVDIVRWTGDNQVQITDLIGDNVKLDSNGVNLILNSWEGDKIIKLNDYIVVEENGQIDRIAAADMDRKFKVKSN